MMKGMSRYTHIVLYGLWVVDTLDPLSTHDRFLLVTQCL